MSIDLKRCSQCGGIMSGKILQDRRVENSYKSYGYVQGMACNSCGRLEEYTEHLSNSSDSLPSQDYNVKISRGYGCGYVCTSSGCDSLLFTKDDYDHAYLLAMETRNDPRVDKDSSFITYLGEDGELLILFGKPPLMFQEMLDKKIGPAEVLKSLRSKGVNHIFDDSIPF